MRVLVACEFSGVVRDAFRSRGVEAYSCDLLRCERGEPHFQMDVREALKDPYDMLIAFPPCTYLCVSGLHWNRRRPGRAEKTEEALALFRDLWNAPVPRIAIENPVGVISSRIVKPNQIIQPYNFGEDASKKTCLWLKGLPPLKPGKYIPPRYSCSCGYILDSALGKYGCANCDGTGKVRSIWGNQTPSGQNKLGPSPTRAADRARTYQGIADAMAEQWGPLVGARGQKGEKG